MDIFNDLLNSIGEFFNSPAVQLMLRVVLAFFIALWLATAFWAYRDLQSRTSNPVAPYLAAALIILFTPFLFPFGVLLYKILRPGTTVADQNERALAEEAMMVEIESQPHCANCARQVHADWIICPTCRNRLRRVCPNCSRLVELDWSLCAWCGKDFERPEVTRDPVPTPVGGRPIPVTAQGEPAGIAARSSIRERLPADQGAAGTPATADH